MTIPEIFKGKKLAKDFKPEIDKFKELTPKQRDKVLEEKISHFTPLQVQSLKHTLKFLKKLPNMDLKQKEELKVWIDFTEKR